MKKDGDARPSIKVKITYARIFIRRKGNNKRTWINVAKNNNLHKAKTAKSNFLYNQITKEYVHSVYARIVIKKEDEKYAWRRTNKRNKNV